MATVTKTLPVGANQMSAEQPHLPAKFPRNRNGRPARELLRFGVANSLPQVSNHQNKPSPAWSGDSRMPVSAGSESLLATLPSFMSVFGGGIDQVGARRADTTSIQASARHPAVSRRTNSASLVSSPIVRRDSTSTFESTESSPTTTISTVESALTDPSPSSSPESPTSLSPLTSFKERRTGSIPNATVMERKDQFSNSFPVLPGLERVGSPNKKMRNMKNLSVNTSAIHRSGPQLPKLALQGTTDALRGQAASAPPTPAFIVPPKAPRREPSSLGLTISTPESSTSLLPGQEKPRLIPQTPSDHHIQSLRLLQNSSSGPLFSPQGAPEGGMRLPPFSIPASTSRSGKAGPPLSISPNSSFDWSLKSPVGKQTLDHVQEETDYDLPLSQEAKSPAYPQGPVCIYDPNVYLYLEPSHVEAREFDVVLNVAREVLNPFANNVEMSLETESTNDRPQTSGASDNAELSGQDTSSKPQTVSESLSDDSLRTLPSTPKAPRPEPEYIHVPWDHNTNVVNDLLNLCEMIDDRVRKGKRVLVHCQCGVSRSASLVVAYGLYKKPQLSVQEAYDAVKNKSRWIGPNMNLIYQLSEFKSKLAKASVNGSHAWHTWRIAGSTWSNAKSLPTPDFGAIQSSSVSSLPKSSSASPQLDHKSLKTESDLPNPPASAQLAANPIAGEVTPGPSSAPPDLIWPFESEKFSDGKGSEVAIERRSTELVPLPTSVASRPNNVTTSELDPEETIQEKEEAPTGAIANDLKEVAKDLDSHEHPIVSASSLRLINLENAGVTPNIDVRSALTSTERVDSFVKPSISTLPAGFSSLFARRHAPQSLPFRDHQRPAQRGQSVLNSSKLEDVPTTPSILSPRAAEFTSSPFHRTSAGDLAGSSVFEQGLISPRAVDQDPRSPHQSGETSIIRSIFDMI